MTPQATSLFDPVTLSYVTAIRGCRPRLPGETFLYATFGLDDAATFCALAASNPEGQFIGFARKEADAIKAAEAAADFGIENANFDAATPQDLSGQLKTKKFALPKLDYLVCLDPKETEAKGAEKTLAAIAGETIDEGGILALRYTVAEGGVEAILHGLLTEIKNAGGDSLKALKDLETYGAAALKKAASVKKVVDAALKSNDAEKAFALAGTETRTHHYAAALRAAGFTYLGQANLKANYLEMSAPKATHQALLAQRGKPYYETAKDVATGTLERTDVWIKEPAPRIDNLVTLFGGFTFGIRRAANDVPDRIETAGEPLPISGELYRKIITHLADMPSTIGDLMTHDNMSHENAIDTLAAVQILAAGGILDVMRAPYSGSSGNLQMPKLAGGYNQVLRRAKLGKDGFIFSSPMLGRPWVMPVLEATLVKEIDRVGFGELASSFADLLPKIKADPRLSKWKLEKEEGRLEASIVLIDQLCQNNLVYWFAYGVFES